MKIIIIVIISFVFIFFFLQKKSFDIKSLTIFHNTKIIQNTTQLIPPIELTTTIYQKNNNYFKLDTLYAGSKNFFEGSILSIIQILFQNDHVDLLQSNNNLYLFKITQENRSFTLLIYNQNKKKLYLVYPFDTNYLPKNFISLQQHFSFASSKEELPSIVLTPSTLILHNFIRQRH